MLRRFSIIFVMFLLSIGAKAQSSGELFFSEYIEGNGNNQAIEVFNPGSEPVDLSNFRLVRSNDGGGWDIWRNFPADISIPPRTVWTIVNGQFTALPYDISLANEKDLSPFIAFRGNDAIGIMKISATDTILSDVIGIPLVNPGSGWDVAGVLSATANHTLIRKSGIEKGNTNWELSRGTNSSDSEWIVKNTDFADSLGQHYFKPVIPITSILLSVSGNATITTDRGVIQINADILPLTASDTILIWSSSEPLVASVNQDGLVQAFNDGTTWITASATDGSGISASIKITTENQNGFLPVSSITVDGFEGQDTINVNQGELLMIASIKPVNASNKAIVWSIDNSNLAEINADGLLTAKKNGKVLVTATSLDGSAVSGSATIVILGQFTEINNISELRAAYNGDETVFRITGEVVLSHWVYNRNIKYVQDAGAGIEIDDAPGKITSLYQVGDAFKGLTGYLEDNYGMLQFHPIEDPGPITAENKTLIPLLLSVQEFNSNFEQYEARLIKINSLSFDQSGGVFEELMNYTVRVGGAITVVRTEFSNADYLGSEIPGNANITGIAIQLNTTPKIAPRKLTDIQWIGVSREDLPFDNTGKIILYPNPAEDVLHVETDLNPEFFEITDITGRTISSGMIDRNMKSIDIHNLSKGLYFIRFNKNSKDFTCRFIKL